MKVKQLVTIAIAMLLVAVSSYLLLNYFSDDRKIKLENWLNLQAELIPGYEADNFLHYLDLNQYGFRLKIRNNQTNYAKNEQKSFLNAARLYGRMTKGSTLALSNIEIEITDDIADVTMNVLYKAHPKGQSYLKQALLDLKLKIVIEENAYKIASMTINTAKNPIGAIL